MKKLIIGLTGPTGSGKSTLCETAKKLGFSVINADQVAHDVTNNNEICKNELQKAFGDIINPDGSLNRKALAAKAFKNSASTAMLNKIALPHIMNEIEIIIKASGDNIILDAPTLFEAGADKICSLVIGVLAPESIRLRRIMERDNLSEEEARLRISAGKPDEFYKEHCHIIIENTSHIEALQRKCRETILKITENAHES